MFTNKQNKDIINYTFLTAIEGFFTEYQGIVETLARNMMIISKK